MLTLENISKSYMLGHEKLQVLDDITFSFPQRGFIGIKGESGCGKSTLLNIISSLEKADRGKILFYNEEIQTPSFLEREIAFISQNHDLISSLTVKENIIIAAKIAGIKYSHHDLIRIVKHLEIEHLLSYYPHQLSGGQKRRVSIARGLLKEASILLADEPTGALHYQQAIEVMELLKEQSQYRLVIIVSHDEQLLKKYCDHILKLENGKLKGKVKQKKEIKQTGSDYQKCSLLFYVFKQLRAQKYIFIFLFLFQIIIIVSLSLILTGMSGIEYELNKSYDNAVLKNTMIIEKYDGSSFTSLPYIKNAYCDFDSVLSLGILSQDAEMNYLPQRCEHIQLKSGRMPQKYDELLVTSVLDKKLKTKHLTYTYQKENFDLTIVGVLEDDFFKEECLYFPYEFRYQISDYMNQQIIVVESQESLTLFKQLEKKYIVSSAVIEAKESYQTLLDLAKLIAIIFFIVSCICSFFLLYVVYQTIGYKRQFDSALLLMMGLSSRRLFALFLLEALFIGLIIGVIGSTMSMIVYYYINQVYDIYSIFSFRLRLSYLFVSKYDFYIIVIVFYTLLSLISAFLPVKKIVHSHLITLLREE